MRVSDFPVGRYLVHIEVFDNKTKKAVVLEQYNTDSLDTATRDLEKASEQVDRAARRRA